MDVRERLDRSLHGRYRIERTLGAGGMAVVYLARDLKHDRPVAVKVLRPELSAATGHERFLREIEIAAGLNHTNILALHDSGEADGLLYFVMPFVEGESLRERMAAGPLPLEQVVAVALEVGSALEYAHGRGLVHRDVKPENVLFQAGHALVCDFGIARVTREARDGLTRTGLALGTPAYMSPEQATGEREVDGRTDVYALACMVWEMLAGAAPFGEGDTRAVLTRKLMGPPPDVSAARPGVPRTVQAVLARGLAPDPDDRHPGPEAFARALAHAATEHAQAEDRARRRRRRGLRAVGYAALLVLLVVAGWRIQNVILGPEIQRVAVLPLRNRPPDPEQAYFAAGLHEDLVLELARAGLRVISASSVARYRETDLPVGDIAEELGVDGVIQGWASHHADSIGVELQLVDGHSQEVIWLDSFDADTRDVVGLYRNMTRAIAERIGARLTPEALERLATAAPQVDPQVFEALLQARFHWQQLTPEGIDTALDYYRLALERDSTSVEAWQGVAFIWGLRVQEGLVEPEEARPHRDSALARAGALDPDFSDDLPGLAVRKTWSEWSWDEADSAFVRALEEDPTDATTRAYYALLLLYTGRTGQAVREMEQAAATDPFNTLVQGLYAQGLNAVGRHREAEANLTRLLRREPEAPFLLSTLRTTYHLMGREEEAMDMWRASYRAAGDAEALAALERGWAEGGYGAALRGVAELLIERSDTAVVRPWQIGTLYTRAGMRDEALHYLEEAYRDREPNIPYLSIDPIFDFMRDDPRFQALLDSLGLPG